MGKQANHCRLYSDFKEFKDLTSTLAQMGKTRAYGYDTIGQWHGGQGADHLGSVSGQCACLRLSGEACFFGAYLSAFATLRRLQVWRTAMRTENFQVCIVEGESKRNVSVKCGRRFLSVWRMVCSGGACGLGRRRVL